jgi:hypothetical protein
MYFMLPSSFFIRQNKLSVSCSHRQTNKTYQKSAMIAEQAQINETWSAFLSGIWSEWGTLGSCREARPGLRGAHLGLVEVKHARQALNPEKIKRFESWRLLAPLAPSRWAASSSWVGTDFRCLCKASKCLKWVPGAGSRSETSTLMARSGRPSFPPLSGAWPRDELPRKCFRHAERRPQALQWADPRMQVPTPPGPLNLQAQREKRPKKAFSNFFTHGINFSQKNK